MTMKLAYMLDVSRCRVPTMAWLQQRIAMLAQLGFNQLQLYMEHTFAYQGHDIVWQDSSPFTADEIRTVDDWCSTMGMELVPCINCLGHMERWLKHEPYRHLAECPDGFTDPWGQIRPWGSTLLPSDKTYAFLQDLFSQILPCFSSKSVNVGMDEPFELGLGRSGVGATGRRELWIHHLHRVHQLAACHGKQIQFWADVLLEEGCDDPCPDDATALAWGYESHTSFAKAAHRLQQQRRPFWLCPGTSSWCSLTGRWTNSLANISDSLDCAHRFGAQGVLLTDWGDAGHHQQAAISLPGLAACVAPQDPVPVLIDLCDGDQQAAQCLIRLGQVQDLLEADLDNSTWLFRAAFADPELLLQQAPPEQAFQLVEAELRDLKQSLVHTTTSLAVEIKHSIDLGLYACTRMAYLRGSISTNTYHVARNDISTNHKTQWSHTSRNGGLKESYNYFFNKREVNEFGC